MKKTYLLIAVLAILSFLIISTKKSYNLVLISIDSLRPDNVKADSQSINKLSESSTVFKMPIQYIQIRSDHITHF